MHGSDDNKSTAEVLRAYHKGKLKEVSPEVLSTVVQGYASSQDEEDLILAAEIYEILGDKRCSREIWDQLETRRRAAMVAADRIPLPTPAA